MIWQILVGLTVLVWGAVVIAALAEDWIERRKHERTRAHIEELERLDAMPGDLPRH